MSNVKAKEGCPLMERPPQSAPEEEPGLAPPPYSSLFGTQPPTYSPLASAPIHIPISPDPRSQDATVHNPSTQVRIDYGKPVAQSLYSSPYAPTTYNPIANVPSVNRTETVTPRLIVSSQSAYSTSRARRWRYLKICSVIATIVVFILVGVRIHQRIQRDKEVARLREEEARKELESFSRNVWNMHVNFDSYYHRKKRTVYQEGIDNSQGYDFFPSNDRASIEDKIWSKNNELVTRNKEIHETKQLSR